MDCENREGLVYTYKKDLWTPDGSQNIRAGQKVKPGIYKIPDVLEQLITDLTEDFPYCVDSKKLGGLVYIARRQDEPDGLEVRLGLPEGFINLEGREVLPHDAQSYDARYIGTHPQLGKHLMWGLPYEQRHPVHMLRNFLLRRKGA